MTVVKTTNFGLSAVRDEVPSVNDWAAVYWNFFSIDTILYAAASGHHHTGEVATADPTGVIDLTNDSSGGTVTPGTRYFGVTYLDDAGLETGLSGVVSMIIPGGIAAPSAPTLVSSAAQTGGLTGRDYYYKLTYTKLDGETLGSLPLYVHFDGTAAMECVLGFTKLSSLTNDADGIIIYRKAGSTGNYVKLVEITDTETATYTDDNTGVPTCDITVPTVNTTGNTNAITIDFSALDYDNAASIKIYTSLTSSWTSANMLITTIDLAATPVTSFEWTGTTLLAGKPPVSTQCISSPSKINLATETTGSLDWDNTDLTWKAPVDTASNLPSGETGDARVVLDEAAIYVMNDAATPIWVLVSGGIISYDYTQEAPENTPGLLYLNQLSENGMWYLLLGQEETISNIAVAFVPDTELKEWSGYFGPWSSEDEEQIPISNGAVRFNIDSKSFEYWDDTVATPGWFAV